VITENLVANYEFLLAALLHVITMVYLLLGVSKRTSVY